MAKTPAQPRDSEALGVLEIRGREVMLDREVALALGMETKRINATVSRNLNKFTDAHSFQLTDEETAHLRSLSATSSRQHGGARYNPRVYTLKGVVRLATILDSPEAQRATDLVIDTFLDVYVQVRGGLRQVTIANPDQFDANADDRKAAQSLRRKMRKALDGLLDALVSGSGDIDPEQAAREVRDGALANVIERLRTKGLENAKLEADTGLVLAEAQKVLAEARRTDAEAQRIDIDVLERKIAVVQKLLDLSRQLEPVAFIDALETFERAPVAKLPPPA